MKVEGVNEQNSNASVNQACNSSPAHGPDSGQSSQISIQVKVPVIVLITSLLDETKIKRAENIFVIKVPFDVRAVKKILYFLKRYYMN